ncbi:MAG: helix-turn-helix domain-containing protein [Haloechinothrix sp.]
MVTAPTTDRGTHGLDALPGDLLRMARRKRGLSQRALATAAGVSHTAVARIEAGKTQPTLATLAKLLAGAGFAPSVDLVSTARPSELLATHKTEILHLAKRHRVRSIQVFGSVATGTDTPTSDLDLLVSFDPTVPGLERVDFAEAIEDLLGLSVDMVNPASASEHFLDAITPQLIPLDEF